jgi:hypothetical protein
VTFEKDPFLRSTRRWDFYVVICCFSESKIYPHSKNLKLINEYDRLASKFGNSPDLGLAVLISLADYSSGIFLKAESRVERSPAKKLLQPPYEEEITNCRKVRRR